MSLHAPRGDPLIRKVKRTFLTRPAQKGSLEVKKGRGCHPIVSDVDTLVFFAIIHLGQEMHAHTWENPKIHQIQTLNLAKQDDWLKETQKKCPIKVIQATARIRLSLSLSEPTCVPILHVYSFPPNKTLYLFRFSLYLYGNSFLHS